MAGKKIKQVVPLNVTVEKDDPAIKGLQQGKNYEVKCLIEGVTVLKVTGKVSAV